MKLDPACCPCCQASARIADTWRRDPRLAEQLRRRPVHGCSCRFLHDPADRCRCDWCQACLAWWPRCAREGCTEPAAPEVCAYHRRQDRERQRARARRQRAVRTPPRPPYEGEAGRCSLCGLTPLPRGRRSWCSQSCVDLWWLATSGQAARRQLEALHGPACWDCGVTWQPGRWPSWRSDVGPPDPRPVELFVDHRRPLWSLTEAERAELRWWLPYNLQLLCLTCHAAKTRREAAERAAIRRGEPVLVPREPDPKLPLDVGR